MPAPPFEIPLPPGFEVIEEPSQLGVGRGGMYAALVQDQRGRVGAVLCRQTRADVVRSLTVFDEEIATLATWLGARR